MSKQKPGFVEYRVWAAEEDNVAADAAKWCLHQVDVMRDNVLVELASGATYTLRAWYSDANERLRKEHGDKVRYRAKKSPA